MQVARPWRRRRRHAALRVPSGCRSELARGRRIEQPGCEDAVLHHGQALGGDALGIEGARAQAAQAARVVEHVDARPEQPLAEPVLEEARLARDRRAVDRAGEMADEGPGHAPVEHDRHAL